PDAHEVLSNHEVTREVKEVRVGIKFPSVKLANQTPTLRGLKAHSDAHFELLMKAEGGSPQMFDSYDRAKNTRWSASSWTRNIDFSGVAWDDVQINGGKQISIGEITMVTPQHGIISKHCVRRRVMPHLAEKDVVHTVPKSNAQAAVQFHDRAGRLVKRRITKYVNLGVWAADTTVVLLDRPVSDSVKKYRVFSQIDSTGQEVDWMQWLGGAKTLNTVRERGATICKVRNIYGKNKAIVYEPVADLPKPFQRMPNRAIGGDSSNPAFVFVKGEPIFVGFFSTGGSNGVFGAGPFLSNQVLVESLDKAASSLGGQGKIGYLKLAP
ncbi:hypothetical protein N9165_03855, partial [Akkermansiaceae bacterium]|nr:hypothetical protein [Akkermansiaceae bacterium]